MPHWIKNYTSIGRTPQRKAILDIAQAGLDAISTKSAIKKGLVIEGDILKVKQHTYDLSKFRSIKVIAIGKASGAAAKALEDVLGDRLSSGISLGITAPECKIIKSFIGTHPLPTEKNTEISEQIADLAQGAGEEDLVIVAVSGGGSALLCWPLDECRQANTLYKKFLETGGTIEELNTLRKHISQIKGGGLAKLLYPATVISLIFSDIPGDEYEMVASGPTYRDHSTIYDAQKIIEKYNLGHFELNETPKEPKYFEKVNNIHLVSNTHALAAMSDKAQQLGLRAKILSAQMYDEQDVALEHIFGQAEEDCVVLVGGETSLKVTKSGGTGGRNMNLAMRAIKLVQAGDVFASVASDGLDNSDAAGGIVDSETQQKAAALDLDSYIANFDCYTFLQKTEDIIMTGPTEANVSDLMILGRFKNEAL